MLINSKEQQQQIAQFQAFVKGLLSDLHTHRHLREDISTQEIDDTVGSLLKTLIMPRGSSPKNIESILESVIDFAEHEHRSAPRLLIEILSFSPGKSGLLPSDQIRLQSILVEFKIALKRPRKPKQKADVIAKAAIRTRNAYRGIIFALAVVGSMLSGVFLFLADRVQKIRMNRIQSVDERNGAELSLAEVAMLRKGGNDKPLLVYCYYDEEPDYSVYPKLNQHSWRKLNMNSRLEFLADFASTYRVKDNVALLFGPKGGLLEEIHPLYVKKQIKSETPPAPKIETLPVPHVEGPSVPKMDKEEFDRLNKEACLKEFAAKGIKTLLCCHPKPHNQRYFWLIEGADWDQWVPKIAELVDQGVVEISKAHQKPYKKLAGSDLLKAKAEKAIFYLCYDNHLPSSTHQSFIRHWADEGIVVYQVQAVSPVEGSIYSTKDFPLLRQHGIQIYTDINDLDSSLATIPSIKTDKEFEEMLEIATQRPVLLLCHLDPCPPCNEIEARIKEYQRLAIKEGHILCYKVLCNTRDPFANKPRAFLKKEGDQLFPTIVTLNKADKDAQLPKYSEWDLKAAKVRVQKEVYVGFKKCSALIDNIMAEGRSKAK